ncbi:MAG: magnesium-protoporphyrin IX monomethyl ester (oxidative) cyclase, partial [Myxococcota bacterium]
RITAEISKQVFPVILDIENPRFLAGLRRIQQLSMRIDEAKQQGFFGRLRAVPMKMRVAANFLRLYMMRPLQNELPDELRVAAAW